MSSNKTEWQIRAEQIEEKLRTDPKRPQNWMPGQKRSAENSQALLIVAIEGGNGDWAAYSMPEGKGPWSRNAPMEQFVEVIVQDGNKLTQELAERLFPSWAYYLQWRS